MLDKQSLGFDNYTPLDLDNIPEILPYPLADKCLITIPSEGIAGTNISTSKLDRLHGGQYIEPINWNKNCGLFLNYIDLNQAENDYRNSVFGSHRPTWLSLAPSDKNFASQDKVLPLDQAILHNPQFLDKVREHIKKLQDSGADTVLFGYSQTLVMEAIARELGLPYYGNADFAQWAGAKVGLQEFLEKHNLPKMHTVTVYNKDDIVSGLEYLQELNYANAVFKVNNSTGGSGHKIINVDKTLAKVADSKYEDIVPEDYFPGEGIVLQGWLEPEEQEGQASIDIMLDLNGVASITHIKTKAHFDTDPLALACYIPVDKRHFELSLPIAKQLLEVYVKERATGPHSINLIFPSKEAAERHDLTYGVPLIHDENSRIGASKCTHSCVAALRLGKAGNGWMDKAIKPKKFRTIPEVLAILRDAGLLIEKASPDAHGVYFYDGVKLINGINKFALIGISRNHDTFEAAALIDEAEAALEKAN